MFFVSLNTKLKVFYQNPNVPEYKEEKCGTPETKAAFNIIRKHFHFYPPGTNNQILKFK